MEGLAGFMADTFIKKFLGNNEARYRRYKYKYAVCQADDGGATALSSPLASKDLYGTQSIGFYGKIRSWKSVAVLQMLEKQMGPESFRKILQNIVMRGRDSNHSLRSLSTKEFRHYANKIGNLERPFLKEFFPRWVGSCGCPFIKMGFSYNKRKNMVELAVLRGCTSRPESWAGFGNKTHDSENREGIIGWPGMMSIRVHEIDGMHDHPILLMSGEPWQLLEIQCHSKLASKRLQKPKKGAKTDGSDDNADAVVTTDVRLNSDSPLLWLRADPEMEYLAEVQLNQPLQMWINQLEKDKDVVAQAQAIAVLKSMPQLSYPVVNALGNFLNDSKAFWRIRILAVYALATTACEETDWSGLLHLINFYKSKRFDPKIGLPRPNDFSDFQEYFVLEAIPQAIAMVRSSDKKSPREAVEFILQLLKYNDNSGNPYSDVFWVASLVQSVGELEFGEQTIVYLTSLLKRFDRLLQFESLMPSHNGILTVSCIQTLTQIAIKLSEFLPLDNIFLLINPYRASKIWHIRIAASRSLLELEFHFKGIDAALALFFRYLSAEASLRGQAKLGLCTLRLCQVAHESDGDNTINSDTLVALLRLLESPLSFNNIYLRHYVFCIFQVLAKRVPTLYGVPRDETLRMGHIKTSTQLKNIFAALVKQSKTTEQHELPISPVAPEASVDFPDALKKHEEPSNAVNLASDASLFSSALQIADIPMEVDAEMIEPETHPIMIPAQDQQPIDQLASSAGYNDFDAEGFRNMDMLQTDHQPIEPVTELEHFGITIPDAPTEPVTTLPNVGEVKKPKLRIKVKQRAETQGRANVPPEEPVNDRILNLDEQNDGDRGLGASGYVSVDAPHRNLVEIVSTSNPNIEDASSYQDVGSRVTASIGRPAISGEEQLVREELQCTADSSKTSLPVTSEDGLPATNLDEANAEPQANIRTDTKPQDHVGTSIEPAVKEKEKKKEKEHKRKRSSHGDDPDRKERKRQKKEKKRLEKEMAKLLAEKQQTEPELSTQEKSSVAANLESETPMAKLLVEKQQIGPELPTQEKSSLAVTLETETLVAPPTSGTVLDTVVGQGVTKETQQNSEVSGVRDAKPEVKGGASGNKPDSNVVAAPTGPSLKIKIKYKNRTLAKP